MLSRTILIAIGISHVLFCRIWEPNAPALKKFSNDQVLFNQQDALSLPRHCRRVGAMEKFVNVDTYANPGKIFCGFDSDDTNFQKVCVHSAQF